MNVLKTLFFAAAVAGVSAIATDADARGRHHHGHHHHHRGHVGIWFGAPLFYPYYAYPRYYYPPAVVSAPPVYIEQPQSVAPPAPVAAPAQSSSAYWYYCRDTQTYYPYVQQCASPWEQVVPNGRPHS